MRYRAIRPIVGKIKMLPGEFVPDNASKKWIKEKLKDLYWFDAELFRIYYRDSHSLNSLSKATKISRATIYKAINNVKNYLKNER